MRGYWVNKNSGLWKFNRHYQQSKRVSKYNFIGNKYINELPSIKYFIGGNYNAVR